MYVKALRANLNKLGEIIECKQIKELDFSDLKFTYRNTKNKFKMYDFDFTLNGTDHNYTLAVGNFTNKTIWKYKQGLKKLPLDKCEYDSIIGVDEDNIIFDLEHCFC